MHVARPGLPTPPGGVPPVSTGRLFVSATHRECLATLTQALAGPPTVIALTGEAGLGKSTVAAHALEGWRGPVEQLRGDSTNMLAALAALAGRPAQASPGVLLIDDAHTATDEMLDRLLLLRGAANPPHVMLVGRTELWQRLRREPHAELERHIAHRAALFPMSYAEADEYLEHLFSLAGGRASMVLKVGERHALLVRARGNMRRIQQELAAALPGHEMGRWSRGGRWAAIAAGTGCALVAVAVAWVATSGEQLFGFGGMQAAVTPGVAVRQQVLAEAPAAPPVGAGAAWPAPSRPEAVEPPGPLVPEAAAAAPAEPGGAGGLPAPAPFAAVTPVAPALPAAAPAAPFAGAAPSAPALPAAAPSTPFAAPAAVVPALPAAVPQFVTAAPIAPALPAPGPTRAPGTQEARLETLPPGPAAVPDTGAAVAGAPDAAPAMDEGEAVAMLLRGLSLLELQDLSGGRRFLERVALRGRGAVQARAAAALAGTFDPARTGPDEAGNVTLALAWYRLAASLGNEEARVAAARLGAVK